MKILLALLSFAIIGSVHARDEVDYSKPTGKLERYMQDLIFGWDRQPRSSRWLYQPTLVVSTTDPVMKTFIESSFNDITQETKLPTSDTFKGKLEVYIGDTNHIKEIAAKNNLKIDLRSDFTSWIYWTSDENPVANRGVILLCSDQVNGTRAEDALLSAMVYCFGLSGKSREYDDTCRAVKSSIITKLTPLDKQALSFFYGHIPPGTSKSDFKKLFEAGWGK